MTTTHSIKDRWTDRQADRHANGLSYCAQYDQLKWVNSNAIFDVSVGAYFFGAPGGPLYVSAVPPMWFPSVDAL